MKTETTLEWITQKEAAEIAGKSLNAVHQLTRAGRLRTKELYGKKLVCREDVLNFEPKKAGRPGKSKTI